MDIQAEITCSISDLEKICVPHVPPIDARWKDFGPHNYGATLDINPAWIRTADTYVFDAEWDPDTLKLLSFGLSRDGRELIYDTRFNVITLAEMLPKFKFIGHNLISDFDVLRANGIPVSNDQIYWDTRLGSATEDPTKDSHALKPLCAAELGLEWPTMKELCTRTVLVTNKKGVTREKRVTFKFQDLPLDEQARYNAMDLLGSYRLMLKQQAALKGRRLMLFNTMEKPTATLVSEMKAKGLKVDREGLKKKQNEIEQTVNELRTTLIQGVGRSDFNLNSPAQVLPFLQSRGHKITSTGEEIIRPLATADPWIGKLLEYRGAAKLLNTYILPLLEHSAKDGRIHTNFNQVAMMPNGKERPIITGRFSSSDPINLQNQPPDMRQYFIPEAGHLFVCADYSQIDLRSLAHLSLEPVYFEAFQKGEKVHQAVADKFGVEYKLGKIFSLAMAYNGGPGRLMQEAQKWGYTLDYWDCKKYSDQFKTRLSVLTTWKQEQYEKAKKLGGVFTLFGRWIPLPYPSPEAIQENSYNVAHWQNCVIAFQGQGGTADIVKGGMLRLRRLGYVPNAQVHDEILYEVPIHQAEEVARVVKRELENVTTLRVPLIAEVKVGDSWATAKP